MRGEFKAGDRVRVTTPGLTRGYLPGCQGTVLGGKEASEAGWESYYVRMDGEAIGCWTVFAAEEIEDVTDVLRPTGASSAASRPDEPNRPRLVPLLPAAATIPSVLVPELSPQGLYSAGDGAGQDEV